MRSSLLLFVLCLCVALQSLGEPLADRPLRLVVLGSEVHLAVPVAGYGPGTGAYFENGSSTPAAAPGERYCVVQFTDLRPNNERPLVARVVALSGGFTETLGGGFLTKMKVEGDGIVAELRCHVPLDDQFHEATVGDFEKAFGDQISFGAVRFRKPLARADFPLTRPMFQQGLHLAVTTDFPPRSAKKDIRRWYVQEKIFVDEPDFTKPYCLVAQIGGTGKTPPAVGTKLRLANLSGGYDHNEALPLSMSFAADLTGVADGKWRFYCATPGAAQLDRTTATQTTTGVLDWVTTIP